MKNIIFKNASWIIGCKIVQSIISLVIGMITARYLGPSNYGLINYASSLIAFVVPIAQLGLRNVLVEEIVSHPEREGVTIGTSLGMSIFASLFCWIGCILFVTVANAGERDTMIVCALYGISLIFQMIEMIQYWFQAKLLSKYTSIASLLAYTVVAIYKIVLLLAGKKVYFFALSYALDYAIISIVLIVIYIKKGSQKLKFSFSIGKKLFAKSRYYIVSSLMVTIFAQTDRIMLKMMIGNSENGYYSTAITLAGISGFVFLAIIDSMRPVIFENKKISREKFENSISVLYAIIIYLGLAQSVFFTIFAKQIVSILYGSAYLPAIPILRIITWYTSFSYMGTVRNIWMLAEEKQKYLWIINLTGAIFNLMGNYMIIPFMGAIGAAIVSVATQFFTNFILCFFFKPIKPISQLIFKTLNPTILLNLIRFAK